MVATTPSVIILWCYGSAMSSSLMMAFGKFIVEVSLGIPVGSTDSLSALYSDLLSFKLLVIVTERVDQAATKMVIIITALSIMII